MTKTPYPRFIEPSHPTHADKVPVGPEWLYEIKHDGYRGQVHVIDGEVHVYTRTGNDWTNRLPNIADAARTLPVQSIIMDGEMGVPGKTGTTDFQLMQRASGRNSPEAKNLVYYAFDLLYLNGEDLRHLPLIERKRRLQAFLKDKDNRLQYLEHLDDKGPEAFQRACAMNMEGLVAKKRHAPYQSDRTQSWLKIKCRNSETYPIIAFVERLGAQPPEIASLYIGQWQDGRLNYAGKVRTGYSDRARREIRALLAPYIRTTSPLSHKINKPKATWVEPKILAEVHVNSVTGEGLVRAASFKGIREELNAVEAIAGAVPIARGDLSAYWARVADKALPYLANRPLAIVRQEEGQVFYHRGPFSDVPASVHQLSIKDSKGKDTTRLWIDSAEGLQGLVQMGVVEIHPWNARIEHIEYADQVVFDLDPGEGVEWPQIASTALRLRDAFNKQGLHSWPKLTGSKGIHVTLPLDTLMRHDEARGFAREISKTIAELDPGQYTISSSKDERAGRIYLDYLRNGRGTTAVGAFSPRARPGAPIAVPVTWRQIEAGRVRADSYTIKNPFRMK